MARREKLVEIVGAPETNRDAGKTFVVIEASAGQSEEWGLRALMALGTSGLVVPQELANAGLIGVMVVGYQAFMGASEAAVLPLWREMLPACVKYQAPTNGIRMDYNETLIEEVSTRLLLRQTIMELHTGFTLAELAQKFHLAASALKLNL